MIVDDVEDDVRTLRKWLNEDLTSPIDRKALSRVLYLMQSEIDKRYPDWEPEIDWSSNDN